MLAHFLLMVVLFALVCLALLDLGWSIDGAEGRLRGGPRDD